MTSLGIMAREGLLKENVDGEALLWAYGRLLQEKSENKILVFFTDGAPVDDSTLSVNPGDFLERHLKSVINRIETESLAVLFEVGIGYDVSRYFSNAAMCTDDKMAAPVFNILRSVTAGNDTIRRGHQSAGSPGS
jgi:cobaltochelatase CobT